MKKIAIVLSEGGMSCAYSVGVVLGLVDKYKLIDPDIVIGASGSSGIAAYFVAKQFEEGQRIWENLLSTEKFISLSRLSKIIDIDYVIDEMFKKQEPLNVEAIRQSKTKLLITATNLTKGDTEYFSNQDDIFEVLRASNAIVLLYGKKIRIKNNDYIDGAISTSFADNINKAKELGATKIIAIDNTNKWPTANLFLRLYKLFHPNLKKLNLSSKFTPDDSIFLFKPSKSLSVMGTLDNNQQRLRETIKIGYDDVMNSKVFEEFLENY
ncbi:MAG: hypothetical protein G01um101424_92 [Parcubacteria group bacterium Gr01-1014_24]|nr:MAG: hypothetical protein G01um101424_92 [Parcubacteria group bacterium Gr01-1014_24]